jgi:hypothetical protein
MAKTKEKTREELIAEANQKTTLSGESDAGTPEVEEDEPLSPEAQAAADKIFAGDDEPKVDPKHEAAEAAFKKLQRIHAAYSPTAPNEHICFGNGGEKFSLGDLRAVIAVLPA